MIQSLRFWVAMLLAIVTGEVQAARDTMVFTEFPCVAIVNGTSVSEKGNSGHVPVFLKDPIPEGEIMFSGDYDSFRELSKSYKTGNVNLFGSDGQCYTFSTTSALGGYNQERGSNIQIKKGCSLTSPQFPAFANSGYRVIVQYISGTAITLTSDTSSVTGEQAPSTGSLKSVGLDIAGGSSFTVKAGKSHALYIYKISIVPVAAEREEVTLAIGDTHYATLYYSDCALTVPAGVYARTYAVSDGLLSEGRTYSEGTIIPAGEAVVVHSSETGEVSFIISDETVEKDVNNMLRGFDDANTTVGDDENGVYKYYMLSLGKDSTNPETVGFYWGTEDGGAFLSGAHKAYLAVPSEQTGGAKGFAFNDGTTSVENVETTGKAVGQEVYDLQGRRVQNPVKGLYIVNGKKVAFQ